MVALPVLVTPPSQGENRQYRERHHHREKITNTGSATIPGRKSPTQGAPPSQGENRQYREHHHPREKIANTGSATITGRKSPTHGAPAQPRRARLASKKIKRLNICSFVRINNCLAKFRIRLIDFMAFKAALNNLISVTSRRPLHLCMLSIFNSSPHKILSNTLASFPHKHCRSNGQRWERNESCRNDYHQSSGRMLAEQNPN